VEKTASFKDLKNITLDIGSYVSKPGQYKIDLKTSFKYPKTNHTMNLNYTIPFTSQSKIKLNHLKMSVTNALEKADEKEITVEYPKRTFKNIKATQNSVIKLKVKLNFGDNQVSKIEQMFLRLRHTELGKTYSAYVSDFKEGYSFINFDLSDQNSIESYDGVYELTLLVSDISLDNPMIWNFGKLDVKFRKPADPSNMNPSYKNIQKPKMDTTFEPEESPTKNILSSMIFSVITLAITAYYFLLIKKSKGNIDNFPHSKKKSSFIFNLLFIIFIFLAAYIMVLFYLKLNIIQTLLCLIALAIPGSFIVFNALKHIKIEV